MKMLTMIPVAPGGPRSRTRVLAAALAIIAISAGSAAAQTSQKTQDANAQWKKLTQAEVDCVDKALRARDSNLWNLIRKGLGPLDPTAAKLRAECRAKTAANSSQSASQTAASKPQPAQPKTPKNEAPKHEASREPLRQYWSLNGATLNFVAEGDLRKFYELPSGAEARGAARGALVLEGKIQDKHFVGTAYRTSSGCGLVTYRVDGMFLDNNRRLELQGQSPRTDAACRSLGTELASLTLKAVDSNFVAARAETRSETRAAASAQARADTIEAASNAYSSRTSVRNAPTGNMQDEKVESDPIPAEPPSKITVDRAAVARPIAKRATGDEPAPEKIVPDRVVTENTDVMQIASVDKSAAAKTGPVKAEAAKAEAAKAAAENGAAEVVVPVVIPIAARGVAPAPAPDNSRPPERPAPAAVKEVQNRFQAPPVANMPTAVSAKAEAERAKADATKALADTEIARKEPATAIAAAISASVAAETRLSFVYGLLSGMVAAGALLLLYFALRSNGTRKLREIITQLVAATALGRKPARAEARAE